MTAPSQQDVSGVTVVGMPPYKETLTSNLQPQECGLAGDGVFRKAVGLQRGRQGEPSCSVPVPVEKGAPLGTWPPHREERDEEGRDLGLQLQPGTRKAAREPHSGGRDRQEPCRTDRRRETRFPGQRDARPGAGERRTASAWASTGRSQSGEDPQTAAGPSAQATPRRGAHCHPGGAAPRAPSAPSSPR